MRAVPLEGEKHMKRFGIPLLSALGLSGGLAARADLSVTSQFNPAEIGQIVGTGLDTTTDRVWLYGGFATQLGSYNFAGASQTAVNRPGESADDADVDFAAEALTLGTTVVPAG